MINTWFMNPLALLRKEVNLYLLSGSPYLFNIPSPQTPSIISNPAVPNCLAVQLVH